MAKKSISQKQAERQRQDNMALQRVFNVFLVGLAAECYLFFVYRGYVMGTVDSLLVWNTILKAGIWAGLVMLLGGAVAAAVKRTNKKFCRIMVWVAAVGLFLTASGWVMTTWFDRGVTAMCIAVPVLTLLGLVYYLFQHECFASTVVLAGALFAVWVCGNGMGGTWKILVTVGAVAAVLVLAALAFLAVQIKRGGGKLGEVRIFSPECDYRVLLAVCGVSAVAILVALLVPAASFYLLWALGILLFAEMVYYTTKLM